MSYYGFFNDSAYQVVDGNIVYASDLNNPMAALETGISSLVDCIQTGATIKTATDTGVVNAYVMSLTAAPAALVDGLEVWLKPAITNSGAATLNLNSLGAKAIRSTRRTALVGGELLAGYPFLLKYLAAADAWLIVSDPGSTELDTTKTVAPGDGIGVSTTDDTITIEIEDGGVSTEKIADGAVTRAKMADDMDVVVHNDIVGGDITVAGSTLTITPCGCWDSTRTVWLETTENDTLVLPSGAGTENDSWLITQVRLVADSSITFQYYVNQAAIDADATINAHRIIDWWQNNSAGTAAKAGYLKNGIHWNLKPSESAVNSLGTVPANCSTAIDCASFLPPADMVDSVLPGAQGSGAAQIVVFGSDGTNVATYRYSALTNLGDTDIYTWGYYGGGLFIPLMVGTNIYWGRGSEGASGTHKALIQAVKLRR